MSFILQQCITSASDAGNLSCGCSPGRNGNPSNQSCQLSQAAIDKKLSQISSRGARTQSGETLPVDRIGW